MCGKNFLSPLYKEMTVQLLSTVYTNRVSKVLKKYIFIQHISDIKDFYIVKKICVK